MDAVSIQRQIEPYLAARAEVVACYLFGSRAEGRGHRESDVDLAVLLDHASCPTPRDRFEARVSLTSEFVALLHCNDVDVVVLNDAPPLLARRIVLEGRCISCANPEADHAFRRRVQLLAPDVARFLERVRAAKLAALVR